MKKERYIEFVFNIPEGSKDAVIHKLRDMGALGFIEKDEETVTYFDAAQDIRRIVDELTGFKEVLKASGLGHEFTFRHDLLADKDWNEAWKKSFEPIEAGDNILIVPSWMEVETDRTVILIDPGRAFGTGHHETTRTCLGLVEKYARDNKGKKLLDIGTGSGILAIGAIILGFESAVGVDNDPPAVEAALHNIGLNGVENVTIKEGDVSSVDGSFDLITANLISETLINIAGQISGRLAPNGIAILSGMLTGQEDGVIKAMQEQGLGYQLKIVDDKWVTLVFAGDS
jgi:ribosomal protein L11 methyltransferase